MRRTFLILGLATALFSGEAQPADPRAEAKAVWNLAAEAGDVWTCLQAEAWAQAQEPKLKVGPLLGRSTIIGSPLLAAPEAIRLHADLGTKIVYGTDHRVYVVAPDGRPLRTSIPLPVLARQQAVSPGGGAFAGGTMQSLNGRRTVCLAGVSLSTGVGTLDAQFQIDNNQNFQGSLAVAEDGSAIACQISRAGVRQVAVLSGAVPEMTDQAWAPFGVGPKGAWVLAYQNGTQVLLRGAKREPVSGAAAGPGIAAALLDGKPTLILADGRDAPLNVGLKLGRQPAIESVGGWLVLASGDGAVASSDGGLLGDDTAAEVVKPCQLVLWRWAELAKDPAAHPVQTIAGTLSSSTIHAPGLLLCEGTAVDLLDLSGDEAKRTRLYDAPEAVTGAYTDGQALIVRHADGRLRVLAPDRNELWLGAADRLFMRRYDLATTVRRSGQGATAKVEYQLQRLSTDPAKRVEIPLPLDPVDQWVGVGFRIDDWVIGQTNRAWKQIGLDGKLMLDGVLQGPNLMPVPSCDVWDATRGRFFRDRSHLILRERGYPADLMDRLELVDAWNFGGTMVLLDSEQHVLASGRKRGEWSDLGRASAADRFGLVGKLAGLLAAGQRPPAVALIGAGPSLVSKLPADPGRIEELPGGPWRVQGFQAVVPHGKQLTFNTAELGFQPVRLRSPDSGGLFIISSSLLIELDGAAATRVFAKGP